MDRNTGGITDHSKAGYCLFGNKNEAAGAAAATVLAFE